MTEADTNTLPDLRQGIDKAELKLNKPLKGVVGETEVLLVRTEDAVFAVGAKCPHKGAPLEDGLVVGHTIRCQWHHACFDMAAQGKPSAPAMDALPCWAVEHRDGKVCVTAAEAMLDTSTSAEKNDMAATSDDAGMVIVGAGATGQAAAESLRRYGYAGQIKLICSSEHLPIDRTALSKTFLSGDQSENDIQIRDEAFYSELDIQLVMNVSVININEKASEVTLSDHTTAPYSKLLLAMGATPRTLPVKGASAANVHTLRHLSDARHLVKALKKPVKNVVIVGSGFIGLEAAAALRERDIKVRVITSDNLPMQTLVGEQMADYIRLKHESQGVRFVFNDKLKIIESSSVRTEQCESFPADLVLMAVGVQPATDFLENSDIVTIDDGVMVDEYLQTSAKNILAAGDLARWPYYGGAEKQSVRIEHWAVAQRQGQVAAENMCGAETPYNAVPFFWSKQYDINIRYSGHADKWDSCEIDGSMEEDSFSIRYKKDQNVVAMLSVNQDLQNLEFEAELEKRIAVNTA